MIEAAVFARPRWAAPVTIASIEAIRQSTSATLAALDAGVEGGALNGPRRADTAQLPTCAGAGNHLARVDWRRLLASTSPGRHLNKA
jgi:hypothetical protein